ncbi:MAG: penicillin-binding protein activator LpoB [Deltaproteobacteria bacterium]|nr:penicillin-binding protein activator LpoB [Deltaproteobacteria bacterium]MBW2218485.1 penicillin-binding protein activator LpoB [Deltaproteobacteria bacterium]
MKKVFPAAITGLMMIWIVFAGCASVRVDRVETDKIIDLSGKWNDTDSRLVSEEMIKDVLNRPWHKKFVSKHSGNLPTVIVGTVRNRSHEHINVNTFVKDLERALINSGEVSFVADRIQREELREELKQQSTHSSEDTAKAPGEEIGADFMLKGEINTIRDKLEGEEVMFYQINLELIDIETHRMVWIGEKKIKKFIERDSFGI